MNKKKLTQAQIKAKNKYDKNNYKNLTIRIRKDNIEVLKQLESVPSKNGYILNLIKEDIANKKALEDIKKEFETLKSVDK